MHSPIDQDLYMTFFDGHRFGVLSPYRRRPMYTREVVAKGLGREEAEKLTTELNKRIYEENQ